MIDHDTLREAVQPATELLRGYIEPQAVDLGNDHDSQIRLSVAVSLKRIADRLDHVTDYFDDQKAQLRVHANCDHRR